MPLIASEAPELISISAKWLVLYKPAGWLTIPPSEGTRPQLKTQAEIALQQEPKGILLKWARERYNEVFVVHRIDRETSGVVLFARTAESHREASLWFQNHKIKKFYDLLAVGDPKAPVIRCNQEIRGAPALTQIEVKERFKVAFLGRAFPVSGRRHQIRIHLSQQGHPILGDKLYKGPGQIPVADRPMAVARVALHAARLELPTGEIFSAVWPKDFEGWVERLRGSVKSG